MDRRKFIKVSGTLAAGAALLSRNEILAKTDFVNVKKKRIALVGTGIRGTTLWGRDLVKNYSDYVDYVGLCDINKGRVEFAKGYIGANCPTFTDFDLMMKTVKPDTLIVTTVDATHNDFIIKGMEYGADIITEKPMTTDEVKCKAILDAKNKYNKNIIVTFNYRYPPHHRKIWELLRSGVIGKITSVDFHWYLDIYHGADYFRRWHGLRDKSGTLLVHKATHHFDLLNWWIESDPEEVFAYGGLEHYGKNNSFRGKNCRECSHKTDCKFYWNIAKDDLLTKLYCNNEIYDGYFRDGCVWRENISIFDKMAVQIIYKNKVQVSYSLTTYSPYEGYRISFNGMDGKLDAWIQERQPWEVPNYNEIRITKNYGKTELIQVPLAEGGHGGGDERMQDRIFKNPNAEDTYKQAAGIREGTMSILTGIAARNSIDTGKPVKFANLIDMNLVK